MNITYTQMYSEYIQKLLGWKLNYKEKSSTHNLKHWIVNLQTWIDNRRIKDNYILEFAH